MRPWMRGPSCSQRSGSPGRDPVRLPDADHASRKLEDPCPAHMAITAGRSCSAVRSPRHRLNHGTTCPCPYSFRFGHPDRSGTKSNPLRPETNRGVRIRTVEGSRRIRGGTRVPAGDLLQLDRSPIPSTGSSVRDLQSGSSAAACRNRSTATAPPRNRAAIARITATWAVVDPDASPRVATTSSGSAPSGRPRTNRVRR